jgi:ORF6N domain
MAKGGALIPAERIERAILLIRGQKVMLDRDLAVLYGVPTKALNQAVGRNQSRFPDDFMFQLSAEELSNWRSQIVTSNSAAKMSIRRRPYVFTEQGVAMLSSVLRSDRAADVNLAVIRTFVKLREVLATHKDLARKVEQHDHQIAILFDRLQKLLAPPNSPKHPIGHIPPKD